jgi:glutathione synthase/RimK-type ligase-like ATP-grasp enzyme
MFKICPGILNYKGKKQIINMKVGILEEKDNDFAAHVKSGLGDIESEYITVNDLRSGKSNYRVVFDRSSYLSPYAREYLKFLSLSETYVINNPMACSESNKFTDMQICSELDIPYPKSVILPMYNANELDFMGAPDLDEVIKYLDLPCVLKPYNGYAWDDVYIVTSIKEFKNLYNATKNRCIMLAQEYIEPKNYYRVYCMGKKDVLFVKYDPKPAGMGKYTLSDLKEIEKLMDKIENWTIKLNKAVDFDINAIEWCISDDGKPYIIDALNDVPEVIKSLFPQEYYDWIVDKICKLIIEKFNSDETNRTVLKI